MYKLKSKAFLSLPRPDLPAEFRHIPLAHRGLHDAKAGIIENSLSAFRAAIDAGYGIELDLQSSLEGEAMVFHDYDLDRLTAEKGAPTQRLAADLQKIKLIGSMDTIPTFAEVLDLVDGRVPLLVEIKDQDGALGPNVGSLATRVATCLRDYNGPVAVMSYNPHSIAALRNVAPDIPRGLTSRAFVNSNWTEVPMRRLKELTPLPDFDPLECCFISHNHNDLTSAPVTALLARNIPVLCWTIKSAQQEARARELATNITFEGYLPVIPQD